MESDQLLKRLQWLEEERRKERDVVVLLENRIVTLEGSINALNQQTRDQSGELTRLSAIVTRMDQYDNNLTQLRMEVRQLIDTFDKEARRREDESEKVRRVEYKALESDIAGLHKENEAFPRLEKSLQARQEEETRLRRLIDELREKIEVLRRDEEEYTRTFRLLDDSRRQDTKRIVDLQGEVAALRKRSDDQRGQNELFMVNIRKLETRQVELTTVEAERRDAISNFLDRQALSEVERDRVWKDWQVRIDALTKQAADVEAKLLSLDSTQREARRIQGVIEELAAKVDRRINEITEIQRLAEDRFRQEWVTFKADDQKRWTNHTLTQEEQRNEFQRQFTRLQENVTQLGDSLQMFQDILNQANEETAKRLQALLNVAHEWTTSFEKTIGRSR